MRGALRAHPGIWTLPTLGWQPPSQPAPVNDILALVLTQYCSWEEEVGWAEEGRVTGVGGRDDVLGTCFLCHPRGTDPLGRQASETAESPPLKQCAHSRQHQVLRILPAFSLTTT